MIRIKFAAAMGLLALVQLASPVPRASAQASTDRDPTYYRIRSARRINTEGREILERRVLVSPALGHDRDKVQKLARSLCTSGICVLLFWESDSMIPHTPEPATAGQAAAIIARYRIDRENAFERFECYDYGDPGEAC